ncbi:hypothetical protein PI124_g19271 [Phytophthora idaei]|nr:hypothetical protein PI125_g20310 [Phytophthora idaei]KAG3235701.1 hypothetical protein PI124_g19271 [Phytophthora idaei]
MERPIPDDTGTPVSGNPSDAADDQAVTNPEIPDDNSRERAHGAISAILNSVTTRHGAKAATQGVRTRADTRVAPSTIAAWTSRTLINPRQRRRAVEFQATPDSVTATESPPANFDPDPEPQHHDAAAAQDFVQQRESVMRWRLLSTTKRNTRTDEGARMWRNLPWKAAYCYLPTASHQLSSRIWARTSSRLGLLGRSEF